jgi:PAS domain S-box-containing protein
MNTLSITLISCIIAAISMAISFIVMVKLETKSITLKVAYFFMAFTAILGIAHELPPEIIIFLWSVVSILFGIGWCRFYLKHKHFFDFAKYESGAAVVLYDIDEKGTIKWMNKEAAQMIGYQREDLIGKSSEDLVKDKTEDNFLNSRSEAYQDLQRHGLAQVIFTYVKKDGNLINIKTIVYPVKIDGKIVHYLGISLRV